MISRRARFALTAMLDVARLARTQPLPAKALTERGGLAPRQLETVLQDLVRAGLLRSVRGPQGGYELARERRRISVAAIVSAIDGDGADDENTAAGPVEAVLAGATRAFMAHLDTATVEDLCRADASGPAPSSSDFHI